MISLNPAREEEETPEAYKLRRFIIKNATKLKKEGHKESMQQLMYIMYRTYESLNK